MDKYVMFNTDDDVVSHLVKKKYRQVKELHSVKLWRSKRGEKYAVSYGLQVLPDLTYCGAAKEMGECLMHSFACDGMLDPA